MKIILLDSQNNYVERSNWLLECQNFLLIQNNIVCRCVYNKIS